MSAGISSSWRIGAGQVYNAPSTYKTKVNSYVNGWFDHTIPREAAYWDKHDLPSDL